jgi:hypothetical protein
MTEELSINTGDTGMDIDQPMSAPAPKRGRPPKASAGREPAREAPREAALNSDGHVVVRGRDGEVLTRRRRDGSDPFFIPDGIIPEGYTYQWNAVTVTGNADVVLDKTMGYYENGWRPVEAERHPGMFVPRGTKGHIIRGGCRLEERPLALTREAQREMEYQARLQMKTQSDSVMGSLNRALPDGFATPNASQRRQLGAGGDNIRMSIDRGLDLPASGGYQIAEE